MDAFSQQVLAGIATGSIYASVALALVMIYQTTHHVNFAQGEMAMFSTFIAWTLIQAGAPYWWAFSATVAASFVLGAAIELLIMRRLKNSPVLAWVVVSIGLLIVFHSLAGWIFDYDLKSFPSPFPGDSGFGGTYLSPHDLGAIGVTLVILALLFVFFRFTPLGLAMRACAQNPISSRLVGIRVGWILALGWGLAGALGAIAGMMVAPVVYLDPHMMSGVLIYAFAAALLGGIDSPLGAVLGGFVVGVLENLVGTYGIGTELKLSVALVLIVAVLIVRPSGLLGKVHVVRV